VIGDGAIWIWNIADEHFPTAIQIVDLYHAVNTCGSLAVSFSPPIPNSDCDG